MQRIFPNISFERFADAVLSPKEVKRVLTMATTLKARAMLTLAYGCGLERWYGSGQAISTASR